MNAQDDIRGHESGSDAQGSFESPSGVRHAGPGHALDAGPGIGVTDRLIRGAVGVVGALSAGVGAVVARARIRARRGGDPAPVSGMFGNGMAYLRMGAGPKTLLWIPGGPGNTLPGGGMALRMGQSWSRPFIEQGYTVWWVTRRQNMPVGHSFADMAKDYAQLIADEFDGKVDVVLGMSTGGQIGFYLAAGHPQTFGHIVIVAAGYADAERDKDLLLRSATLLSQGRTGQAMALFVDDMYPRVPRLARHALGEWMGRSMYGKPHPYFANDVVVEAEAEAACDAREVLPDIKVPVLLVAGDQDHYFPREMYQETAQLIPDCTLLLYEGKGHEGLLSEKRFVKDVLDFVRHAAAVSPDSDNPRGDQPTATE